MPDTITSLNSAIQILTEIRDGMQKKETVPATPVSPEAMAVLKNLVSSSFPAVEVIGGVHLLFNPDRIENVLITELVNNGLIENHIGGQWDKMYYPTKAGDELVNGKL